jgi:hypothetical protein
LFALSVASTEYRLTGIGGPDLIGVFVIGALCFRVGKEAFGKAKARSYV